MSECLFIMPVLQLGSGQILHSLAPDIECPVAHWILLIVANLPHDIWGLASNNYCFLHLLQWFGARAATEYFWEY